MSSKSLATYSQLRASLQHVVPKLGHHAHKGQAGRIGVMGGSSAYAGAPFFAAMASLKMGADLSTIFCSADAGIPIKSFSPDIMVRPSLYPMYMAKEALQRLQASEEPTQQQHAADTVLPLIVDDIFAWTSRLDVLVLGCGLGKDELTTRTVAEWLKRNAQQKEQGEKEKDKKKKNVPIVVDGDGIHVLLENPHLLQSRDSASSNHSALLASTSSDILLTPNAMEFRRLWMKFIGEENVPDFNVDTEADDYLKNNPEGGEIPPDHPLARDTSQLAKVLGGVSILRKGSVDVISNGSAAVVVATKGSPRRVGGQGDLLAGACGTFIAWIRAAKEKKDEKIGLPLPDLIYATWAACTFCRHVQQETFSHYGRSLLASQMLECIPIVLHRTFPVEGVEDMPKTRFKL